MEKKSEHSGAVAGLFQLAPPQESSDEGRMSEAGTILFVDDNDSLREVLARILARGGYTVMQAESAEAAYSLLPQGEGVDLVISDVVMSGDGVRGLIEHARAVSPSIRFLLISGHPLSNIERTYGIPGARFLQKPFTPQELLATVNRIFGHGG